MHFEFLEATSIHDIDMITYKKHAKDWQRPLKNTEVACYYSHQNAWGKIIQRKVCIYQKPEFEGHKIQ
jgi:GR25 family glycosyltransferase involved in LPS biosynthesis